MKGESCDHETGGWTLNLQIREVSNLITIYNILNYEYIYCLNNYSVCMPACICSISLCSLLLINCNIL